MIPLRLDCPACGHADEPGALSIAGDRLLVRCARCGAEHEVVPFGDGASQGGREIATGELSSAPASPSDAPEGGGDVQDRESGPRAPTEGPTQGEIDATDARLAVLAELGDLPGELVEAYRRAVGDGDTVEAHQRLVTAAAQLDLLVDAARLYRARSRALGPQDSLGAAMVERVAQATVEKIAARSGGAPRRVKRGRWASIKLAAALIFTGMCFTVAAALLARACSGLRALTPP